MRLYLDMCCLKRGFDDQSQARVAQEADAVELLLAKFSFGAVEVCSSEVLELENSRNPNDQRRSHVEQLLASLRRRVKLNVRVEQRAEELAQLGFASLDALHLASAEQAKADVFVTCDDDLLRKSERVALRCEVLDPVETVRRL